jgi:cob(I)alamin adenosyltransferase
VPKTHPRIEAYGTVDELNSQLGLLVAGGGLPDEFRPWVERVQNDLFDVGADLAVPADAADRERLRIVESQITWLEERCDEVNERLEPLRSFLLPGGSPAGAQLHVCRTICRRAERRALEVDGVSPEVVRYLNRLSDLLFILARAASEGEERLWSPGAGR